MQMDQSNPCIKCTVSSCAYHNSKDQACTLQSIQVGYCNSHVANPGETECASFKLGNHGTQCTD